jgi:hypothetical protein
MKAARKGGLRCVGERFYIPVILSDWSNAEGVEGPAAVLHFVRIAGGATST